MPVYVLGIAVYVQHATCPIAKHGWGKQCRDRYAAIRASKAITTSSNWVTDLPVIQAGFVALDR